MTEHLGDVKTSAAMAIVTGDPDRVPSLAGALAEGPHRTSSQRGFIIAEVEDALGTGSSLLVVSTGIGGPAAALIADELWHLGITQIVRVGTCGSMQRHVRPGSLVISSATVRDEGTSRQYIPIELPAAPDPTLFTELIKSAQDAGAAWHAGTTHCKDAYCTERPFGMPLSAEWSARWTMLRSLGVLATEMESAALFAVGTVRRVRTGALLVPVDGTISQDQLLTAVQGAARIATVAMQRVAKLEGERQ